MLGLHDLDKVQNQSRFRFRVRYKACIGVASITRGMIVLPLLFIGHLLTLAVTILFLLLARAVYVAQFSTR